MKPVWALLAVWAVLGIALGFFAYLVARVGLVSAIILVVCYFAGTICTEARDAASRCGRTGNVLRDVKVAFNLAWSNEHSATFIYHSLQWLALAIAATLLTSVIAPDNQSGQ